MAEDIQHKETVEKYRRQRAKILQVLEYVDAQKDLLFEKQDKLMAQ